MIRLLRWIILGMLFCTALMAAGVTLYALIATQAPQLPLSFSLKAGSSLRTATQQLAQSGAIGNALPFEILARLLGESTNIKAGNYEIDGPISPLDLLRKITRGEYSQDAITFIEGWTFSQVRRRLHEHPALRHDTRGMSETDIAQHLGIEQTSPEGWLFPDTYHFSKGSSDLTVLRRAHQLMREHLARAWEQRVPGLALNNPYEALILASIVEKETGRADERPLVAAVFANRLRIGMRLQTDPTVIYGLGERFDGNLRKKDLLADGPYNTYTRAGLPPTPIAIPGLAAIQATLAPARSTALYFVARGDGTSHFSRNLDEHERAVTKYQRGGRH